ncbi:hypothetical protein NKG94_13730 [Micromonospora sp. M12]
MLFTSNLSYAFTDPFAVRFLAGVGGRSGTAPACCWCRCRRRRPTPGGRWRTPPSTGSASTASPTRSGRWT